MIPNRVVNGPDRDGPWSNKYNFILIGMKSIVTFHVYNFSNYKVIFITDG